MILDETRPARERIIWRAEHVLQQRKQTCSHCGEELWGGSVYARLVVDRKKTLEVRRYCGACL